ncbi:TetR/AcrR family transcriptional regulator [Saccharibacillus deserti]|uniref:TetR/AcrR family transcriptional regulator n=1 Tax=Saccharibacillus deserti TaxID=1634444 RepID=UPI001552C527|nr:TetR/AcrR family transcriptional regulator [Saccharibacillus deserti]
MTQMTKRALAASLKKLLSQKTLDKITVIDIAEDCEVNRQTFYYHFKDIYDLIDWIYTHEASKALNGNKTYETWQQGFLHIFEYIQSNRNFVLNTYHSVNREHLERYLHQETHALLIGVIEEKAAGRSVREDDKAFIAHFYKFAFVGLILDWIGRGMREEPLAIVKRLSVLIHGDFAGALERFESGAHPGGPRPPSG